jgi:iron complex transport system ATP-binding protein
MRAEILSDCLGHQIDIIEHGKRRIFIPKEDVA